MTDTVDVVVSEATGNQPPLIMTEAKPWPSKRQLRWLKMHNLLAYIMVRQAMHREEYSDRIALLLACMEEDREASMLSKKKKRTPSA